VWAPRDQPPSHYTPCSASQTPPYRARNRPPQPAPPHSDSHSCPASTAPAHRPPKASRRRRTRTCLRCSTWRCIGTRGVIGVLLFCATVKREPRDIDTV
jgi:hypothetical protein